MFEREARVEFSLSSRALPKYRVVVGCFLCSSDFLESDKCNILALRARTPRSNTTYSPGDGGYGDPSDSVGLNTSLFAWHAEICSSRKVQKLKNACFIV